MPSIASDDALLSALLLCGGRSLSGTCTLLMLFIYHEEKLKILIALIPLRITIPGESTRKSVSIPSPNTSFTEVISWSHENTMIRDERSYRVVCFEGSHSMRDCERKGEIPHKSFLLVRHQSCFHAIALSK